MKLAIAACLFLLQLNAVIGHAADVSCSSALNYGLISWHEARGSFLREPLLLTEATVTGLLQRRVAIRALHTGETRQKDFRNLSDSLRPLAPIITNANIYSRLKAEFRSSSIEHSLREIGANVNEAFRDIYSIQNWIIELRAEIDQTIVEAGLKHLLQNMRVREYFLDFIVARRMANSGFRLAANELPFDLVTFRNDVVFLRILARPSPFIDWAGDRLYVGDLNHRHYIRGHLLQFGYAASRVPEFSRFIQYIGEHEQIRLWSLLFDNTNERDSTFSPTVWVEHFAQYLGIGS